MNRSELIELGRENFYAFCRLTAPDFYKPDRLYLKEICTELQSLYENDNGRLAIHVAPRHGKTRTIIQFVAWLLGKNKNNQIIATTYNEVLSGRLGKDIRDLIGTRGVGGGDFFSYKDFFPSTFVNPSDSSRTMWSLKGKHFNFLATSPNGTATGIGCNFLIIDDIIKNHLEAMNQTHKENLWEWYINTLQSRMQKGCRVIVVNTRWAVDDIGGKLYESESDRWKRCIYPAYFDDTDTMLCEEIKSLEEFKTHMEKAKRNQHSWAIFRANYFQEPVSFSMSNIFSSIPSYIEKPTFERYLGYIDAANGGDYLCFILAGLYDNKLYVLDVVYEQDKIEVTVPKIIEVLKRNLKIQNIACSIEVETNGAIGFKTLLNEKINENSLSVYIEEKHSRESKLLRINNALLCANLYYLFPNEIYLLHENFYNDLIGYNPSGKNKHDDAPDTMAGLLKYFMENYMIEEDSFRGWQY